MKLHLPKKLLAAVLTCLFAAGTTYAEVTYSKSTIELPNVININFAGEKASTTGKTGSVSLPYGENFIAYESPAWTTVNDASGTATVTDLLGEEYTLTWQSNNTWNSDVSTDTLVGAITKGYLDMGSGGSATFSLSAAEGTVLNWKQVNIIFSGDSGSFGKVEVGGTEYYYNGGTLTEVAAGENPTWGTRSGSTTLTEGTNLMCVSNTAAAQNTLTVTGKSNNGDRATIAGFQIVLEGSTGTFIADTGTISGLVEGESASASGLGLDTSYNSTFTVNVDATTDVADDVALLTLDQNLKVGTLSVQGGALRLAVNEGSSFGGSIELGSNASLAFSGTGDVVSVSNLILNDGAGALILEGGVGVTITTKLASGIAANTFQVGEGSTLSIAGNYTAPAHFQAVLNSFTGDGTLKFVDAQTDMQPNSAAYAGTVVGKKVVFDRGLTLSGWSQAGETQKFTVGAGAEVTVNTQALEARRMNVNVEGGKLTANAGILIGHPENGNYPGWVNLRGGEIVTTFIKGQNNNAGSAFTMTGGTLTIAGEEAFGLTEDAKKLAVNLQGGTIRTTAAQMNLTSTGNAASGNLVFEIGNVTFDTGEGHTINLNHDFTQTGTLTVTGSGTLNISGNVTLADVARLDAGSDVSYSYGGNGYLQASYVVVKGPGTVTGLNSVMLNDHEYTLAESGGNRVVTLNGTDGDYYVRTGEVRYTGTGESSASVAGEAATGIVLNGGSLTLEQNLNDGVNISLSADGTVKLASENVTLNSDRITRNEHALTLSGSGKYVAANTFVTHADVTNLSDYMGATLGDDWTGTVVFDGGDFWGADLGSITKGSIELSGVSGMFAKGDSTCTVNLILTDKADETAAFSVNNGWNGDHVTFSGAVSGSGTLKRSASSGSAKTFTFTGDVSGWTGKFDSAFDAENGYKTLIEFSGNATTINASVTSTGDSLVNVTINNDSNVTVNGEIELAATTADCNGTLALQGTGAKSFTNTVTAGSINISGGNAGFTGSVTTGTLTVGAATTMSSLTLSGAATLDATLGVTTFNMGNGSTVTANGSLTHDGVTYSGGAIIRNNGGSSSALSVWDQNFSITGGTVAINGSVQEPVGDRNVNAVFDGSAVTFNGSGKMSLTGTQNFASLTATAATATLDIGNGATGSNTTIGNLSGFSGVEVREGNSLTLGAGTSELSNLAGSGSLIVQTGKVLTVDGAIGSTTLSNGSSLKVTSGKTFTTGNETITKLTEGTDTTISGTGTVSVATAGITYTNAAITVDTDETLETAATLSSSKLTVTGGGTATVKVEEGATNDFDASSGSVTIDAPTASVGDLTVGDGKTVTIGNNGTGTATVSGTATLANGSTVGGDVTIADSGTLVISGTGFSADGLGAIVDGTLTANATAVSLADKIDVSGITTTTTYVLATAQTMTITGNFDASNFYIGTLAEGMTATVSMQSMAGATYAIDPTTASQLVLTLTAADPDAPVTLTATAVGTSYTDGTLNINVTGFDSSALSGKDLAVSVDREAWESIVTAMSGVEGGVYNTATITLNSMALDNFGTVSFNGYTGTGAKGEYFVAYIPEPATATLSLLALAALAARRRRK